MKKIKKVLVLMTSMFVISSLSSCTGDDIAQLRNQISEIQNELTSIQNQISELQRKMDGDITSVKNDYNGKISTLLEKQTSLEIELNALQEELKKNKEELETELNSNIESLQKYFDDKISTLNSRISSDEAELATLKTKHDNDVASLKADYEGKVSELNANITSTKQELQDDYNTKLNTLNEEFNAEMSSLQSDVEANKDKIDALQAKHDKDVSNLKADYESSISELDEKLSKTEKVLQDDYNSKLDTLNTTYNAKCNALQADIDSCNASISSFKEQYEVDKKALEDDYVAKISALNEAFETRSSSIESSISKINEDISSLKEEMNTLIQEIQADYNDKISALSSRISSLEEKKTYQVYFHLDGNIIKQETVNEGDKIYVPSYELTKGYNISSWYTYDSGLRCPWSFSGCSVTSNIDLYADFTYESYSVHFVDNKQGLSDKYQNVSYKKYYNFSTIYSKTGYTLTGFKDSDGNDFSISGYYTKTSGITLYANWSLNEYSITYNLDGGSIDSSLNPTSYSIESDTITLSNPSKEGYRFDGWYDGSKIVTSIKSGSIGNINLTATWSKYYSINVSSSDTTKGSVEIISSQDKYCYKDSVTIKATSNNGYKFESWTNNGVVISTNSEYTFFMPSYDYNIVANFESPKNLSGSC